MGKEWRFRFATRGCCATTFSRRPIGIARGHAYASEHDNYFAKCHTAGVWQRGAFQEQTPEARLRRQKAMPLIAEDPTRVPDYLFSGPDLPMDDSVRARFFGEL